MVIATKKRIYSNLYRKLDCFLWLFNSGRVCVLYVSIFVCVFVLLSILFFLLFDFNICSCWEICGNMFVRVRRSSEQKKGRVRSVSMMACSHWCVYLWVCLVAQYAFALNASLVTETQFEVEKKSFVQHLIPIFCLSFWLLCLKKRTAYAHNRCCESFLLDSSVQFRCSMFNVVPVLFEFRGFSKVVKNLCIHVQSE